MNKFKVGQKVKIIRKGIVGIIDYIDGTDYYEQYRS